MIILCWCCSSMTRAKVINVADTTLLQRNCRPARCQTYNPSSSSICWWYNQITQINKDLSQTQKQLLDTQYLFILTFTRWWRMQFNKFLQLPSNLCTVFQRQSWVKEGFNFRIWCLEWCFWSISWIHRRIPV